MNSAGVGSVLEEGVAERSKWRDAIAGTIVGDDAKAALNVDVEGVHIDDETFVALSQMATDEHVRICALGAYQLSSCVGDKFLKAPYSDYPSTTDDDGKRTGKSVRSLQSSMPSIAVRKDLSREKTRNITEWQTSLLYSHSYAAISVHLNTLDDHVRLFFASNNKYPSQIIWSKSRLQQKCRECKKRGDAQATSALLLCIDCDKAYHTYCLRPPLDKMPDENWKCPECVRAATAAVRKSVNLFKDVIVIV